jgi:catalase
VKYHFISDQGVENLTQAEADALVSSDTDFPHPRPVRGDRAGDYPSWTLKVQVMPFEDAKTYRFNPFDLTKVWPHSDYPLTDVGEDDLGPQPDRPPCRDRAAGRRAEQLGAGDRTEPGQDALGPDVLLPRRPPLPDRRQLQRAARERTGGARAQLQQGRGHALHQGVRPGVRPELQGRPGGRHRSATANRRAGTPTATWCTPPTPSTPKTTTGARPARWSEVFDDAQRDRLVSNIVGHLLDGVTEPVLNGRSSTGGTSTRISATGSKRASVSTKGPSSTFTYQGNDRRIVTATPGHLLNVLTPCRRPTKSRSRPATRLRRGPAVCDPGRYFKLTIC